MQPAVPRNVMCRRIEHAGRGDDAVSTHREVSCSVRRFSGGEVARRLHPRQRRGMEEDDLGLDAGLTYTFCPALAY